MPAGFRKLKNYTPEQQQLFSNSFANVGQGSYLSRLAGGDQSLFGEMEAPAHRQFNELQGNIASRFSGLGMGSRRGSGFQNSMSQASSNFAQDLQSRRQELQRNALQDLTSMSHQLLNQRPYSYMQKGPSLLEQILGGIIGAGSEAGGQFARGYFSQSGSNPLAGGGGYAL